MVRACSLNRHTRVLRVQFFCVFNSNHVSYKEYHCTSSRKLIYIILNVKMYLTGFAKHGEVFDPHKVSLILMFTMFQFIFMTVCLSWTRFMFNYEIISALYLVWITAMAIWNGGSYYIQIFSQRYNTKFLTPSNKTIDHQLSLSNNSDNTDKSD